MISDVDQVISRLLQNELGLPADSIFFDAPDSNFITRAATLPKDSAALSIYMFGFSENTALKQGQRIVERPMPPQAGKGEKANGEVGSAIIKGPPIYFNLDYVICGWAASPGEVQDIIWDASLVLMKKTPIPVDLFTGQLREQMAQPLRTLTLVREGNETMEFWQAFGVAPRPAIFYRVIMPIALDALYEARIVRTRRYRLYDKSRHE